MKKSDAHALIKEFGPLKWYRNLEGIPGIGWFLMEISPLPPKEQIPLVISDIMASQIVRISNGRLFHSDSCSAETHSIPSSISTCMKNLKSDAFRVAVYPGEFPLLNGQPIAIALNPSISYMHYPNHPHINMGIPGSISGQNFYVPNSICYIDDPSNLGNTDFDRLLNAFDQICIWLFRHQVWLATGGASGNGIWIGPHKMSLLPRHYATQINPTSRCRCSKKRLYKDCCMPNDIVDEVGCSFKDSLRIIEERTKSHQWEFRVGFNETRFFKGLQKSFTISSAYQF